MVNSKQQRKKGPLYKEKPIFPFVRQIDPDFFNRTPTRRSR